MLELSRNTKSDWSLQQAARKRERWMSLYSPSVTYGVRKSGLTRRETASLALSILTPVSKRLGVKANAAIWAAKLLAGRVNAVFA